MTDIALSADALAALANRVVTENRASGRIIALAESCTGGLVSAAITDVPGSSDVFAAGFVTYADAIKQSVLGVSGEVIETFGAVSAACAWAMAHGALEKTGADIAVAITGIAGPGGGSATKPVGTVVFARARRGDPPDGCYTKKCTFDAALGRDGIRRQAVAVALELLLPDPVP
jgi:nicotinamide-nucleotide amidase